jgi:hypothetical protein
MTSTASQRQAAFRARRRAEGLEEVRGIWAPKALHKQIKQEAGRIASDSWVVESAIRVAIAKRA